MPVSRQFLHKETNLTGFWLILDHSANLDDCWRTALPSGSSTDVLLGSSWLIDMFIPASIPPFSGTSLESPLRYDLDRCCGWRSTLILFPFSPKDCNRFVSNISSVICPSIIWILLASLEENSPLLPLTVMLPPPNFSVSVYRVTSPITLLPISTPSLVCSININDKKV